MIKKVEMFTVVCDNCDKDNGSDSDYSCWGDMSYALEEAMNSDWITHEEKHYCTECWLHGDNDEIIINDSRNKTNKP